MVSEIASKNSRDWMKMKTILENLGGEGYIISCLVFSLFSNF